MNVLSHIFSIIFLTTSLSAEQLDPYAWLEDTSRKETQSWISLQKNQADAYFSSTSYQVVKERLEEIESFAAYGLPLSHEGTLYFLRKSDDTGRAVLCKMQTEGTHEELFDPETLNYEETVTLTAFFLSPDGRKAALVLSVSGSDQKQVAIFNLEKKILEEMLLHVTFSHPTFSRDSLRLYYCRFDQSDRKLANQKLCCHRLGTHQDEDTFVHAFKAGEKSLFQEYAELEDGHMLILYRNMKTSETEILIKDAAETRSIGKGQGTYQFVGEFQGKLLFYTNHRAPRGKGVTYSDGVWETFIPESERVLEELALIKGGVVGSFLRDAIAELTLYDWSGNVREEIPLPGKGTVTFRQHGLGVKGNKNEKWFFFTYTDFATPSQIYCYDPEKGVLDSPFQYELSWNPDDYVTHQVFYRSKDGTQIPLFVVHRKDLDLSQPHPTLLYGYGGFGIALTPEFNLVQFGWLDQGGVFALANIRGGGEYGEEWHQAGMGEKKQTVFDDFISAAEWLQQAGITTSDQLAIYGRSNGGLLTAACLTQRPELFGAVVVSVGVLDMLKFHEFTIGWAWEKEYGSPDDPSAFSFLSSYSPYHNILGGKRYPATLIITGEKDDRVVPYHSYKFAAALQEAHDGERPVLLRLLKDTGHGEGKTRVQKIEEATDILSFILAETL